MDVQAIISMITYINIEDFDFIKNGVKTRQVTKLINFKMGSYTASTTFVKPKEVKRAWHIIDAEGKSLGRIAARVAMVLRGKHKASYTPFIDCGDNVVIINAEKVLITGKKLKQNVFYWHTGYPGGIKERTWNKIPSEKLMRKTIQRMLPKESPLATMQFKKRLRVYCGDIHPHAPQSPQVFKFLKQKYETK